MNFISNSFIAMSLIISFSLCSCSFQTKVSEEKFCEEANKIGEHFYSSATLKINSYYEYSFMGATNTTENTGEYHYTFLENRWYSDEEGAYSEEFYGVLRQMLPEILTDFKENMSIPENSSFTYYINPFKIVLEGHDENESEGFDFRINATYVFDKNGYYTSVDVHMSKTYPENYYREPSIKQDIQLSISYK